MHERRNSLEKLTHIAILLFNKQVKKRGKLVSFDQFMEKSCELSGEAANVSTAEQVPQQQDGQPQQKQQQQQQHHALMKNRYKNKSLITEQSQSQHQQNASSRGYFNSSSIVSASNRTRLATLTQIGEDWLYLALLGTIMALLSFSMDTVITLFLNTRPLLFNDLSEDNLLIQYLGWCITPIVLVVFSSGFVHVCSPTAIGSGIPEMKTILRGVVLNEYLTFRTLIAKIVGLTFTLGSGLPLGKEGPFVHMASIVATLLSKLVASFQGIYENESRTSEMLSAACAVGVAATFYAPIGGVLFSIEVTTVYFAVRNYWRGFFAACCGATIWRLLAFWIKNDESISALFKTNFRTDFPFDPIELIVFSFIGASCGLAGAAYIKFHREIVQFFRRHKRISAFLQQNRFVYPIFVTLVITTVTFPPFIGKYTASTLSTHTTIEHLFSNITWSLGNQDLPSKRILDQWTTEDTGFHLHLVLYIVMLFWTSALASTIPIPSGLFIPVLKMGAAYGRLLGELMHQAFPDGIKYGEYVHPASIVPGSYAVVGAAAFSGAVTHTISTSVILFEMTGQIVHIIPVILGVLIANAVCQSLQPSIYDSIIEIKKLPYLPPIASSNSISHRILVKDFMNTNLAYIWKEKCTYGDLKALLGKHKKIIAFPLVESPKSMKLLGSVPRPDLLKLLYLHLGRERRLQEVCRRNSDTLTPSIVFNSSSTINEGDLANTKFALVSPIPVPTTAAPEKRIFQKLEPAQLLLSTVGNQKSRLDSKFSIEDVDKITKNRFTPDKKELNSQVTMSKDDEEEEKMSDKERASRSNLLLLSSSSSSSLDSVVNASPVKPKRRGSTSRSILNENPNVNYGATIPQDKLDNNRLCTVSSASSTSSTSSSDDDDHHALGSTVGCAKIINHYDRGSTMDEEYLDKSILEIEHHMASVDEAPEVVVVLPQIDIVDPDRPALDGEVSDTTTVGVVKPIVLQQSPLLQIGANDPPDHPQATLRVKRIRSPHVPLPATPPTELRSAPSFTKQITGGGTASSFSSPSSRPTKSILKTSSTNSMYKRNTSSQSFSSNIVNFSTGSSTPPMGGSRKHISLPMEYQTPNQRGPSTRTRRLSVVLGGGGGRFTLGEGGSYGSHRVTHSPIDATNLESASSELTSVVRKRRKVRLPRLRVVDMTPEEQEQWEKEQLDAYIDISKCQIDEAPFQLVEQTSLYRVHTLFSMLGLNHAYVTSFGRLVGIVALKDIRYAIEKMLQEK